LAEISMETLGASRAAQERFLERLAARAPDAAAFRPERIRFGAGPGDVGRREEFRSHYRLVKFLGRCSREVLLGTLETVGRQLAARARIEAHFREWDVPGAGFGGAEAVCDACSLLRAMGCYGAPLVLFSDLQKPDAGLWQFVYEHPVVRIAWVASELLACAGAPEFEAICHTSPALKNLREISDGGLWPQVVLPVSAANVRALPELVGGLLELTRGASIEMLPTTLLPAFKQRAPPPEVGEYVEALLQIYAAPSTPLHLVSPLSWVSARIDSEVAMISSAASAGAEIVVLPDGELYASEFGAGIERWRLGNVLKDRENLRWERLDVIPEALSCSGQPQRCRACDWRFRCGGLDASAFMLEERRQVQAQAAASEEAPWGTGWPGPLAELHCAPRKRLFEEMLWGSAEAAARGRTSGARERLELSDEGVGYVPVASGT